MNGCQAQSSDVHTPCDAPARSRETEAAAASLLKETDLVNRILRELPSTFGDTLAYYMNKYGYSEEVLEERSHISVRTLSRMRNDPDVNITKGQLVALSIAFKLPPRLSHNLRVKAGILFKDTTDDLLLETLMQQKYKGTVDECNALLNALDRPALTDRKRCG